MRRREKCKNRMSIGVYIDKIKARLSFLFFLFFLMLRIDNKYKEDVKEQEYSLFKEDNIHSFLLEKESIINNKQYAQSIHGKA